MEVREIFAKLRAHMLEGIVFHDEMARYYGFLNLKGYEKCHEYHYAEESKSYRELCRYYLSRFHAFIPVEPMNRPNVIPESWYKATMKDVDKGTRQSGIKSGIEKWVAWEKKTKELYQDMYLSLVEIGEPAAAMKVACCVKDVDQELEYAEAKHMMLEGIGYDLPTVISKQDELYDRYKHKLKEFRL